MKYYSGIGSRQTVFHIRKYMTEIACTLEQNGYILRSGNAIGADQAFAEKVQNAQIWLPEKDYNIDFQESHPTHDYRVVSLPSLPCSTFFL